MKYEDSNKAESKKLLKSNGEEGLYRYKSSFLSNNFLTFLKVINLYLLSYVVLSTIFYLIVHYYGKRIIASKALRLEYDSLLYQNLFVNFYFILVSVLGFITSNRKSIKYFCWFCITISLYSTLFILSYVCNFHYDYFFSSKFVWIGTSVCLINFSILVYLVHYFISTVNKNQEIINNSLNTPSAIIHEICLRTDMFKISFNHFIIRMKLHKLIPSLLYKKDSFYYTKIQMRKDFDREDKFEKVEKFNEDKSVYVDSKCTQSTFSGTRDHIYN